MDDNPADTAYSPIDPPQRTPSDGIVPTMSRTSSGTSGRLRSASLRFLESSPPLGAWHATGEALGRAPTHGDIRRGSFSYNGWDAALQRRNSIVSSDESQTFTGTTSNISPTPGIRQSGLETHEEAEVENDIFSNVSGQGRHRSDPADDDDDLAPEDDRPSRSTGFETSTAARKGPPISSTPFNQGPNADGVYPNGYKFPPKHTRKESISIGFKAFCKYAITPLGFLVVVYCLNVVAWGGMLFLLLVGGGNQYMCYPERLHGIKNCNDLWSPRRIWLEIDSQILNALFCVTGLGLIPWRFRDLYYLLQYRLLHKQAGLRKLGGIHNGWFRLPGSAELPVMPKSSYLAEDLDNPALPIPASKIPDGPLTGIRAPATKLWRLDYVIWAFVLNTFLQCVLCGFMWGYNRFDRPSWATGTFIALACIVAGLGGLMTFQEAKKVKAVEGIPPDEAKVLQDIENGVELKQERKDGENQQSESKRKQQNADEGAPKNPGDEEKSFKRTSSKLSKKRPGSGGKL